MHSALSSSAPNSDRVACFLTAEEAAALLAISTVHTRLQQDKTSRQRIILKQIFLLERLSLNATAASRTISLAVCTISQFGFRFHVKG